MRKPKTLSRLKKELDKAFNAFIRARDSDELGNFQCISCGEVKGKSQLQAGHFWAAGKYTNVRWDEDNCWGQCIACNCFNHGNLYAYSQRLIKRIGHARFNALENKAHETVKLDRLWLTEMIELYKNKI